MVRTDQCPDIVQLRLLMLGRISDSAAAPLEAHVETCLACGKHLDDLKEDSDQLAWRGPSPALTGPDRVFVDRLIHQLHRTGWPRDEAWAANVRTAPSTGLKTPPLHGGSGNLSLADDGCFGFLSPPLTADELGRLNSYRVLRVLGRGGMAVVFLAEDLRLKRTVALKVILENRRSEPHYRARFEHEAEILARLRHANIVQVHEVGNHRGRDFFALEYVAGGTLADALVNRTSMPTAREAAQFVSVLAAAIHYAHEQGIVHRDLKPSNILLSDERAATDRDKEPIPSTGPCVRAFAFPKVADFGLAKRLDSQGLTETGDLLGTPSYMAPELTRGVSAETGASADIYSLGAILYELLTARPPFRGESVLETLEHVRTLDPLPPRRLRPRLPRDLETICLKCLAREPQRRYATASALADDLGRFLDGRPILARPVGAMERLRKWAQRRPAFASLIVLCLLFVITLIAGVLVHNSRLTAAKDLAQRQEQRADQGYKQARSALKKMLGRLEDKGRFNMPRLKELQQEQLEDALTFYLDILNEQDNADPEVRSDVAQACQEAAGLQLRLGQLDRAVANLQRAIALWEPLCAEYQDRSDYREQAAASRESLGLAYTQTGGFDQGLDQLRRALAERQWLHESLPDDADRQDLLARSHHNLARALQGRANWSEAGTHLQMAIALRTALLTVSPDDRGYSTRLAGDYINLYQVLLYTDKPSEAEAACAEAVSLLEPVVKQQPDDLELVLNLAAAFSNWGEFKRLHHDLAGAIPLLTRAIQLAEEVLHQEPQYLEASARLVNSYGPRGLAYLDCNRFAEAIKDWDRVVELSQEPERYFRRLNRALILALAGERTRAAVEADELSNDAKVKMGDARVTLARIYALCLKNTPGRPSPSGEEKARFDGFAKQALSQLRAAAEAGYFLNSGHLHELKTNTELDPLRPRADFKKLLSDLDETAK